MTTAALIKSITTLTQHIKKLLDQHAVTLVQALSLLVIGLLLSGFRSIANGPVYAAWMYFITALLAFAVIAFILLRSSKQR